MNKEIEYVYEVSCKTCGWFNPHNFDKIQAANLDAQHHELVKNHTGTLVIQRRSKEEVEA